MRAAQTGRATPASIVFALPATDPLRVWQAFQSLTPGECFYWEQPERQIALVSSGAALSIQARGRERFIAAAQVWRHLREEAVVEYAADLEQEVASAEHGPVLVGGFSFDPQRSRSDLWQDFPDGLLILPRLLFTQRAGRAALTFSCLVSTADNLDNLTNIMSEELARFSELMAGQCASSAPTFHAAQHCAVRDVWSASAWKELVGRAVSSIRHGAYAKIVLAREAEITHRAFELTQTLQNLRESYPNACVFAFQRGEQAFIGATPERLIHAQDGKLHTAALAGSAPRGANAEEDRRLGCELLRSPKNRGEHEIVTAMLRDSLARLCSRVWVADTPELLRLKNIQHLQTAIVGELLPGRTLLEALHILHPTPAVGGTPTEAALSFIREHENLDRGWYAGPLGWIDLQGNGEFVVALRSALLEKHRATLFAGCGIVKDSDPEAEYAESCLKLQVILRSLAGEE